MKKLLNILAIIFLSVCSAFATVFVYNHFMLKTDQRQPNVNTLVEEYLKANSQKVFEIIAKSDNFGETIRHFSGVDSEELIELIDQRIAEKSDAISSESIGNDQEDETEETQTDNEANSLYRQHWDQLINSEVSPTIGPKDAKVTVVEFFDFACGHCKALAPVISQIIKDNPDVRFIFNPLYFISEHSAYAAKVSLAAAQKGKFAEVFDGIMTLPEMNEETINQILMDEGLNLEEIKKMIDEKEIRRGIQDIDSLSQVLGINGVPMLLINGEAFYGRNVTDIQNKLNSYK